VRCGDHVRQSGGVALVIAVEILGIRSLAFAVGSYLSIGTTAAMFAGGLVRVLVEATTKKKDESEASPGALSIKRPSTSTYLRTTRALSFLPLMETSRNCVSST
jgi:hypothetical protein